MDRGAWRATVRGVAKTQTWLNNSAWHKRAWVLIRDADAWAPPYRDLNSVAGAKIHCG